MGGREDRFERGRDEAGRVGADLLREGPFEPAGHPEGEFAVGQGQRLLGQNALLAAVALGHAGGVEDLGCNVYDPETHCRTVESFVARDSKIPTRRTITYYSHADQTRIVLNIVAMKSPGERCNNLGYLEALIDRPGRNHPLEVTIGYGEDGMVSVVARDPDSGARSNATSPA